MFYLSGISFSNPFFIKMLRNIKKKHPNIKIVLEIATFPFYKELRSFSGKLNLILELISKNKLKKYIDIIITYCGQSKIYGVPSVSISNGIKIPDKTPPFNVPKKLNTNNTPFGRCKLNSLAWV